MEKKGGRGGYIRRGRISGTLRYVCVCVCICVCMCVYVCVCVCVCVYVCVLEWGGDSTCRQISCEPSETADSFTSMCTQLTELKGGDLIYPDLFMPVF